MKLEGAYDTHLEAQQAIGHERYYCAHCHHETDPEQLYEHVASGETELCQDCLAKFLEADIEDSSFDHAGHWRNWTFKKTADPWAKKLLGPYEASRDEDITGAPTVAEVLELVLIQMKLI